MLAAPGTADLCSSLEHRRAGRPAQVVVTLGQMGTPDQHRAALWLEAWGRSYPMCGPCWDAADPSVAVPSAAASTPDQSH